MPTSATRAGTWAIVALAGAIASSGCEVRAGEGDFSVDFWQGRAQDTWERTYTVAPGGRVEVLNVNGEIRAEASPDGGRARAGRAQRPAPAPTRPPRTCCGRSRCAKRSAPAACASRPAAPRGALARPQGHLRRAGSGGGPRRPAHRERRRAARQRRRRCPGRVHQWRGPRPADRRVARSTPGPPTAASNSNWSGRWPGDGRVSLASVNGGVRLAVPEATQADVTARCTNGRVTVSDLALDDRGRTDAAPGRRPAQRRRRPHRPADDQRRRGDSPRSGNRHSVSRDRPLAAAGRARRCPETADCRTLGSVCTAAP